MFDTYFLMREEDIESYVREKLNFFDTDAKLTCKEIGDGNLNYVFRLKDENSGKSIIIKQAGESLRISEKIKISTDRGRIESDILTLQSRYANTLVPRIYLYDPIMCAIIMEDMISHAMMRTELMQHKIFPLFSEHISDFLVNTLLMTSDIVMEHKEKKALVKKFTNPQLCEISEDLVFSEPFIDYNDRNDIFLPNKKFIEDEIYNDKTLHLEAAKLKFAFMNHAQALIHGDLHTGSIFINESHTFIFDPEFAFYGPMGYDIGNIIANMFFAYCHGDAMIEDIEKKEAFSAWVIDCIEEIIDKFIQKFKTAYQENAKDIMAIREGFMEYYLSQVLSDTAGFAGMESIRRVVGMAKNKDITSITDEAKRVRAEQMILSLAKDYILHRERFQSGKEYRKAIEKVIQKF